MSFFITSYTNVLMPGETSTGDEDTRDVSYRGNQGFLWKADYAKSLLNHFPKLRPVKEKRFPYIEAANVGNTDAMYLLEKTG